MLLTSCKTAVPSSNTIKNDLVNEKIALHQGDILIKDSKNIEKINVIKKDINKQKRYYLATIDLTIKNEDITLNGTANAEYHYIPEKGWILQHITMDDEATEIEVNTDLDSDTLQNILTGNTLKFESENQTIYWELNPTNKITEVEILETIKSENGFSNKVKLSLKSKNSSEEFLADINLSLIYSLNNHSWNIEDIEVTNAERKLYAGISVDRLKELLTNRRIDDVLNIRFADEIKKYHWDIDEEDEIKDLEILEQDTNLKEYKDAVNAKLILEKGNLRVFCKVTTDCIYDSEGWRINDFSVTGKSNTYELLSEPNINLDILSKDLVGMKFNYKGYIFGQSWNIEEGELQSADIIDKLPLDYGCTLKYLVNIELKGSKESISGDSFITYYYDQDTETWKLKKIEKVNDFIVKSNNSKLPTT